MQAGAVLLSRMIAEDAARVPVATRLNNVKFKKMVRPGDTVVLEVELTERLADAFFMNARVTCDGKMAACFDFACTLAPAPHESTETKTVTTSTETTSASILPD